MSVYLFIAVPHDRANVEHGPAFLNAVTTRRKATGAARSHAQRRVNELFQLLYPAGMSFEDPYTPKGVLWTFGVSWLKDIRPLLDSKGRMSLSQVRVLDARLARAANGFDVKAAFERNKDRSVLFSQAAAAIADEVKLQAWQRYYSKRRDAFKAFVTRAVKLRSGIDCGLNV